MHYAEQQQATSEIPPLASQVGIDTSIEVSHASLVIPHGASQARRQVENKPRFADFACNHSEVSFVSRFRELLRPNSWMSTQVYRFAATVVLTVVPRGFWGSKRNLKVILSRKVITYLDPSVTLNYSSFRYCQLYHLPTV